ncbi:uncharacterized protein LOC106171838 [Lingula anatina]|uniref:Uncharacterized protein LOC106171838 n=1 Tax=Lingula anatina TaxID=7574 RepID=A0A1S3JC64_LINAN|nr:uncharacterized protein LOC106171838 [Lingula anatina]|eukprot:XP_013407776.1 uncharacterized protein LOC106171838 [Lingula anatina]
MQIWLILILGSSLILLVGAGTLKRADVQIITAHSGDNVTFNVSLPVKPHPKLPVDFCKDSECLIQYVLSSDKPVEWLTNNTNGLENRMGLVIPKNGNVNIRIRNIRPEDSGTYTFRVTPPDEFPVNISLELKVLNGSFLPPNRNWIGILGPVAVVIVIAVALLVSYPWRCLGKASPTSSDNV